MLQKLTQNHPSRLAIVMPRGMYFGPSMATSIDLCARDFVRYSRYADQTTVFCEQIDLPFDDVSVCFHEPRNKAQLDHNLRNYDPDLVLVHQHLPTAGRIAKMLKGCPVLLHRHNFTKPKNGVLSRIIHKRRYRRLSGVIFVSEACKKSFNSQWPEVKCPKYVIHNGLDFSQWTPEDNREKCFFFAGRMAPEKGVLDFSKSVAAILNRHKDWKARLICSRGLHNENYKKEVLSHLSAISGQVDYMEDQPFSIVKSSYERAAIAVVPSRFEEPFGRTAIEAFAGGAALITSGTGGLTEVVGDAALVLPNMTSQSLTEAMECLVEDPELLENLATKGRQRGVSHFSIETVTTKLDQIYTRFLSEDRL